jgi:hypothetical protein
MTTTYGLAIDCVGHPAAHLVRTAGFRSIALYVGTPGRKKAPTAAMVADYLAAGLHLILVYEDTTGSWRGGQARGVADGQAVRAHLAQLGIDWAKVGCVYHAYDEDVTAADLPLARLYAIGAAQAYGGPHRVGVYGSRMVIADLLDRGLAGRAWASAGWQYGHIDPRCVLEQRIPQINIGGVPCDVDDILAADFGQYPAPAPVAPPVAPAPAPPVTPGRSSEDAVALLEFPPTPLPAAPPGGRWQDTDPATWPRSVEHRTALVPAVPGGWRGRGSISAIVAGWAGDQDPPAPNGTAKPSGFIEYLRVFHMGDQAYSQWLATNGVVNTALVGNRSLAAVPLPAWCTFLVVRYAAPGGLYLGIEWER